MSEATNQQSGEGEAENGEQAGPEFPVTLQRAYDRFMKLKHIDAKTFGEHYFFPLIKKMYEEFDGAIADIEEEVDSVGAAVEGIDDSVTEALADSPQIVKEFSEYVLWTTMMFQQIFRKSGWLAVNPDDKNQVAFTELADAEVKESYAKIAAMSQQMANKIKELEKIIEDYETDDEVEGEDPNAANAAVAATVNGTPVATVTPATADPVQLDASVGVTSSSAITDQPATPTQV